MSSEGCYSSSENLIKKNMAKSSRFLSSLEAFHSDRTAIVRNLDEKLNPIIVAEMLVGVIATAININSNSHTAKVKLSSALEYEKLSDMIKERTFWEYNNSRINISLSGNENLLCLSHLPCDYQEKEFLELVKMFGPITHAFLMVDRTNGESLGYGFAKYISREVANQARNLLHLKIVNESSVHCDWVDSNLTTYDSLISACLYVDLPPNYFNMGEFRETFSRKSAPPYCQIAFNNGKPIGFGLIEYNSNVESMQSFKLLKDDVTIFGQKVRINFCIPGVKAINIYNRVIKSMKDTKKEGLFPDPPAATAYLSRLQLLALQKPEVSSNILGIVSNEIRNVIGKKLRDNNATGISCPVSAYSTPSLRRQEVPRQANVTDDFTRILQPPMIGAVQGHLLGVHMRANASAISNQSNNAIAAIQRSLQHPNDAWQNWNAIANFTQPLVYGIPPVASTGPPVNAQQQVNGRRKNGLVFRRPLSEKVSPNENRYVPYQRPSNKANSVWDYSPVSSRTNNSNSVHERQCRRMPHILPSPEASPDDMYVGQHSQGIGGHYADSYLERKTLKF